MDDLISKQAVSSWLKQYGQDVLHRKYKFSLMYIWKNLMDLPSAQLEQKWTPCSERCPKENGYYLTSTINKEVYCDYWSYDHFDRTEAVIAWMRLPDPYREGDTT